MSYRRRPTAGLFKFLIALAAFGGAAYVFGLLPGTGVALVVVAVAAALCLAAVIRWLEMRKDRYNSTYLERPTEISTLAFPPESKVVLDRMHLFRAK